MEPVDKKCSLICIFAPAWGKGSSAPCRGRNKIQFFIHHGFHFARLSAVCVPPVATTPRPAGAEKHSKYWQKSMCVKALRGRTVCRLEEIESDLLRDET